MGNHKGISILLCSYLFLIELLSCSIHMHVSQSIFLFLSPSVLTFLCSWLGAAPVGAHSIVGSCWWVNLVFLLQYLWLTD